jgi:hypothetical protein
MTERQRKVGLIGRVSMAGYLDFFGILDWYSTLPITIQNGICKAAECPGEWGFKADQLFNGEISSTSWKPVDFMCNLALNSLHSKDHPTCDALMQKAFYLCNSKKDGQYYAVIANRISDEKSIYPDQNEINRYKALILSFLADNPGALQMNIKKQFPVTDEYAVGHALSQLNAEGILQREKSGRSFQLWVKA